MSSTDNNEAKRQSTQFWGAVGLLVVAVVLGGGGAAYGLHNAAVQWVALGVLAVSLSASQTFWTQAPISFRLLCAASIALPVLHLLPLPASMWQPLPGRELITQSLQAAGVEPGWRPLTVNVARTLVAGFALLVPLALIAVAFGLSRRQIQQLGWVVVSLGLLNFLWGIPQVLSQGATAIPYPENPMPGVLFGSFANRNSTAIFFVSCLILALNLDMPERVARWTIALRTALGLVFTAGIFLTQSRSGIALTALPAALVAWRILAANQAMPSKKAIALFGSVVAGLVAIAVVSVPGSRIETALDRFSGNDGYRTQICEDAVFSADRFWPIGAGMGSFDEVFQIDESLEHVSPRTAGRAHNDFIELAIEGGALALALLSAWLIWTIWLMWRARQAPGRWIAWSGGAILFAIALQSVVDYPLRSLAMLAIAALAMTLLFRFSVLDQRDLK